MNLLTQVTVARAGDATLSLFEWLQFLKLSGKAKTLIFEAASSMLLRQYAKEAGLSINDQELQEAVNAFRMRSGLNLATDTYCWLNKRGIDVTDLEQALEANLLIAKLRDYITRDLIHDYFHKNIEEYNRVKLRKIVLESEGQSRELLTQLLNAEATFSQLASDYSMDFESRRTGGSLGVVFRKWLRHEVAEAIFQSQPGAIVGPIVNDDGYHLFLVETILPSELDDATRSAIRDELFIMWVRSKLQDLTVDLSWLDES